MPQQHLDLSQLDLNHKNILIIAVPCIGDTFLALPLVSSIKAKYPNVTVDMMVRKGTDGIVQYASLVSKVISFDGKSKILGYIKMVFAVFRKYDLAISTSTSDRSILTCFYAASKRISVVPPQRKEDWWKRMLLDANLENDLNNHTVVQNLHLAELLGLEKKYQFDLDLPQALSVDFNIPSKNYILIHCFSGVESKNLSNQFWIELIQGIHDLNLHVVLTSGPDKHEVSKVTEIANHFGDNVSNYAGKLNFQDVFYLLKSAKCYVGVDTCVTHIAATLGTPTVAIFGSSNLAKWSPWPSQYQDEKPPFPDQEGCFKTGNVAVIKNSLTDKDLKAKAFDLVKSFLLE